MIFVVVSYLTSWKPDFLLSLFKFGSGLFETDLAMQFRLAWNSWAFCLCLPNAGMMGLCLQAWQVCHFKGQMNHFISNLGWLWGSSELIYRKCLCHWQGFGSQRYYYGESVSLTTSQYFILDLCLFCPYPGWSHAHSAFLSFGENMIALPCGC